MHLMFLPVLDASGNPTGERRYTLDKVLDGQVTRSAHPARFSPDDKWSRHRLTMRKRFGPNFEQAVVKAAESTGKAAQANPPVPEMKGLKISEEVADKMMTDANDGNKESK